MKTAALAGGPEALKLLARWSPDPRSAVQRALAQAWRYFDPADYAKAVLREAPLDEGSITVTLIEHIPHLRTLQHLRDVSLLLLYDSDKVGDLVFLRDAPPATTQLHAHFSGPVDFSPLANCPALENVHVLGGSTGTLEVLAALPVLKYLSI